MAEQKFRHLVRVATTDLEGKKEILYALRKIKGVGINYANMVCKLAGVSARRKAGELSDTELKKIDEVIKNPASFGAPAWLFNRRKDLETGADKHIITSDLQFIQEGDMKLMKKIKCYKGVRHMRGLPVRGQKTRSNFRPNKGKVTGVKKVAGIKKRGRV